MKRKMLFFERFMYVDGVTPINCVMTARVRGTLGAAHLQNALAKVQAKHPLLRARVVEEDGEPCFVIDESTPGIPVRIVPRESGDAWKAITVAEWKVPFDTKVGPLLRVVWLQAQNISELMLVAHHCICDGGSIANLLREILQATDEPETELTRYSAYASLEDLLPSHVLSDSKQVGRVKKKATGYKIFLAVLGCRRTKPLSGEPYALYWNEAADEFAAINARCNAEETNSYAALCVAFLLAFRHVQGKSARNKIMCPVSIRRFVRSIKSDMMFAFAPTVALSLDKDRHADFWTQARQMKYTLGKKIDAMNVYEQLMLGDEMRSSVTRIVNFLRTSRGGHDVAFSNVGRLKIPARYGSFSVEAIVGATVAVPWRNTNTLIMTHYLQDMTLSFISNERFLSRREAEAIMEKARKLLEDAMAEPRIAEQSTAPSVPS